MSNQYPWHNSSSDISSSQSQWETPGDAQAKADAAEEAANDYSDGKLAEHVGTGGNAHASVTTSIAGFMSGTDKAKLDGIQSGAEVNQNAFAQVNTVAAGAASDSLTIAAGLGIAITNQPLSNTILITATGDTAPAPHASTHLSDGSDPIDLATTSKAGIVQLTNATDSTSTTTAATPSAVKAAYDAAAAAQSTANGVGSDLTAHVADDAAHGLGHYYIQRTSSTLGGYSGETITCGFYPRKITCQAFVDTGSDKRQSTGFILSAGGISASQCVGIDTNGYAIAAYNGDIGTLKLDASNYLQINVIAFSGTGFTVGVTRVGYAGDDSAILLMFMVE